MFRVFLDYFIKINGISLCLVQKKIRLKKNQGGLYLQIPELPSVIKYRNIIH